MQSIRAGGSASYAIDIARTNYADAINLEVRGLPPGATASFSADPAPGKSSLLSVATTPRTATGVYSLIISANAPGIAIAPVTVRLEIPGFASFLVSALRLTARKKR
jgi:uncharacterized membrane protein